MPNDYSAIQRQNILGLALKTLRAKTVMPQLSYRGIEVGRNSGNLNEVINLPKPQRRGTRAAISSHLPQQGVDRVQETIPVRIDQWEEALPFTISDRDMSLLINPDEHFMPMELAEAVSGLADFANREIFKNYVDVYGVTGTPGTLAFSGTDASDAANAQAVALDQRSDPLRYVVMDPYTAAAAKVNPQLSDYDKTGSGFTRVQGSLGLKMGMEWFEDQDTPFHTAGTAAGAMAVNGAVLAGAKTFNIDGGTGNLLGGDIITIDGNDQTYTVISTDPLDQAGVGVANVAAGVVNVEPAFPEDIPDGALVTLTPSHRVNLAFADNAFALASVPLLVPSMSKRGVSIMRDPMTGLVLRLEFVDQHNQSYWKLDILFGDKCINPEYAVRIFS